jgi:hydroxymethylpyrimidine/phosphomethylpyrimidine kinase
VEAWLGEGVAERAPRVLCVGGTDPTGGAGLAADVRTLACLGAFASVVVTAVTVQTSSSVSDIFHIPASIVRAQLAAALEEPGCDVIKTGMLGHEDIVRALAEAPLSAKQRLVVDPIVSSSSGRRLLSAEGIDLLRTALLPRAALVTPNRPELEILLGRKLLTEEDVELGASELLATGCGAVLVKGGHAEGESSIDFLVTVDGDASRIERPRLRTQARGTGCTYAAAIAAGLAEGLTLVGAAERGRDYVQQALKEQSVPAKSGFLLPPLCRFAS